ncbi:hypothetical protein Pmar_PMAR026921 [Perkinsus marinus ATCC 50983]|uniref:Uncharacterized protein n=1 Tax=Perkinsus marinus (strain ATCC 50983 / TXsc) TaxID=423536 RepID=C5LP47_PERM5|nr:hypothetical protein Pmar_PMAR026921 [Perkinsus marinus ATCC 50983]EER01498.1 hypothetical protein Pmar_PMAR026921 [Perkinsus marinus ATCC 50983]|eukprot:XP_002768780.1 hypothetical protein Pmar_PMAR026921 [Perkinsus marinus ATCC 50983]
MAIQSGGFEEDECSPPIFPDDDDAPQRGTGLLSGTYSPVDIDGQAKALRNKSAITKGVLKGGATLDEPVTLGRKGEGKDRNGSIRKAIQKSDTVAFRSSSARGTLGNSKIAITPSNILWHSMTDDSLAICSTIPDADFLLRKLFPGDPGRAAEVDALVLSPQNDPIPAVTYSKLREVAKGLRRDAALGEDDVTNGIILDTLEVLKDNWCTQFTEALETGVYPDGWKSSKGIFIHKAGRDPTKPNG